MSETVAVLGFFLLIGLLVSRMLKHEHEDIAHGFQRREGNAGDSM